MAQNLQQYFEFQGLQDAPAFKSILNFSEKGSDTLIIHPGSHSIKFGLASQSQPFIVPNVIAHPRKDGQKVFDYQRQGELDATRQQMFEFQLEKYLPEIEHQLRKKRFLLIDAKSAKNIRNKQVSFKIFEEGNCINEYNEQGEDTFSVTEQEIMQSELTYNLDKFAFVNLQETMQQNTSLRPHFVGREALALHKNEEYLLRYPIKYGDLNVSAQYDIHQCVQDLQTILEQSIHKYMRLPKKNLENFNCILIIPDVFVKHHLRYLATMVLGKMKFKSLFIHTESVMATFAMAMSTACVVDIGSSKISVCCIDEGILVPKSIIRKHYGGDEINEMFYRLITRSKGGLHYFPKSMLNPQYHYHKQILEFLKENFTLTEMDVGENVKTCSVKIKEKLNERHRKCQQLTFNCSDSLVLAPQSIFYSQLIGILQKIKDDTTNQSEYKNGDPLQVAECFQDPEDLMHDIIQMLNAQANNPSGILKTAQSFKDHKQDQETPGNTPSVSIQQDVQSEIGDEDLNGEKFISQYQKHQDPMDLDEMICRSICTVDSVDVRKKLANSIVLIGGVSKTRKISDSVEEAVMDRFTSGFDNTIERVNVELVNVQQNAQYLQHQAFLQSTGQPTQEGVPEHLKIDPRFTSWVGATVIPKLESSKDMFIQRDKYIIDIKPYKEQFQEQKQILVQQGLDSQKQDQEEKKANEDIMNLEGLGTIHKDANNPELTPAQIDQIEKEVSRKLKKERTFEAGVKQIREKAPFHL